MMLMWCIQIEKISFGNESCGLGYGVYVEEVEVVVFNEEFFIFFCCCWLVEDEGDGKFSRVL